MSALTMILESTGSGFSGFSSYDPATDDLGHMTMTEAAAYLPIVIMENSIEAAREEAKVNDALVESVVMAHLSGSEPDYQAISENALQSAWDKIKKFFKKIIEAIKRVIQKIQVFIESYFMKAKSFVAKYEKSKQLDKNFSNLTFTGYKFVPNIADIWNDKIKASTPSELIELANVATGMRLTAPENAKKYSDTTKNLDNSMLVTSTENIKDVDSSEQTSKLFKHATNQDLGGDSVKEGLMKLLMGDEGKTELNYGTGGFDKNSIITYLKNPDDITKMKKQYEDLLKAAKQQEKDMTTAADNYKYSSDKTNEDKSNAETKYAAYLSAFTNVLSNVYGFVSAVKDAKVSAANAKINQNKAMLRKLLNTDQKKMDKMNEDFDEIDAFDLELDV